jgi:hypothetical protein
MGSECGLSLNIFYLLKYAKRKRHKLNKVMMSIDLKLLTSGNPILSNEQNGIIFKHVFEYIKRSERFLV